MLLVVGTASVSRFVSAQVTAGSWPAGRPAGAMTEPNSQSMPFFRGNAAITTAAPAAAAADAAVAATAAAAAAAASMAVPLWRCRRCWR